MKPPVLRIVHLLILLTLARVPMFAQDRDDAGARAKILALEHTWNQAEAFKDLKALDALLDSRLVYVDPDSRLMTKAEFLAQVKSSALQQVITQLMTVEVFDNTAVVTGLYAAKILKGGRTVVLQGRFVDTWVLKNGNWICVGAQSTPAR